MSETAGNPTYPVGTIARLLKLTERRVQQLSKEGVIPKTEKNRYELAPAVQGYIGYLQDRMAGNSAMPADFHIEKARLVKAQADKAELEANELNGKLVRVEDVKKELFESITDCKNRLMSIASKAAPIVANETEPGVVQSIIDDLVREALKELSEGADEPSQNDSAKGNDSVEAAAETKGQRVGRRKKKT